MGYREIAERQHGFILPCQLTDEEFVEVPRHGCPRCLGIRVSNQGF